MPTTERWGADYRQLLAKTLPTLDNTARTAKIIGKNFDSAEKAYFDQLSNPKASQAEVLAAESSYQKAVRVYTAFSQLMKNSFQIMMEGIRGLNLR